MEGEGGRRPDEEVAVAEDEHSGERGARRDAASAGGGEPRAALGRAARRGRLARALRGALLATAALVLVGLAYLGVCFAAVVRGASLDEARAVDAIVVLGAAQYHGRPSPVLERRLLRALHLYRQGHAAVIVTTGSNQPGDAVTEGYAGFEYLLRRGVPEQDLVVVVHGEDTWQELSATSYVLAARGMSKVLLVSDPYHSCRSKRAAVEAGLEPYVSPTGARPTVRQLGREAVGVAVGGLIGYRRMSRIR